MSLASSKLFQPLQIGNITLKHRVVMAPMSRFRTDIDHVHQDIAIEYYRQRSIVPGTLIITEATIMAEEAGGLNYSPGIYTEAQLDVWKKITDVVHANGSYIYVQLLALGRSGDAAMLAAKGHRLVAPSAIAMPEKVAQGPPHALTVEEIEHYYDLYVTAAKNSVQAGFDGVELHGANGFLIDQFTQDTSNKRTDQYGGSIENRVRFGLDVVKHVSDAIGQAKTSIRLGPYVTGRGMRMEDPVPTFTYFLENLRDRFPDLAYVHVIEPQPSSASGRTDESTEWARKIWAPRPYLAAGGFQPETAAKAVEQTEGMAIVFGKWFVSNPDLPHRIKKGLPLTPFDPTTFYTTPGPDKRQGYIDYPLTAPVSAVKSGVVQA